MVDPGAIFQSVAEKSSGAGCLTVTCSCGITHFCSEGDYEEGELEALQVKAELDRKRYIEQDFDAISVRRYAGSEWVVGCPCNWEHRVGRQLLADQRMIMEFYRMYRNELLAEAKELDNGISRCTDD